MINKYFKRKKKLATAELLCNALNCTLAQYLLSEQDSPFDQCNFKAQTEVGAVAGFNLEI